MELENKVGYWLCKTIPQKRAVFPIRKGYRDVRPVACSNARPGWAGKKDVGKRGDGVWPGASHCFAQPRES